MPKLSPAIQADEMFAKPLESLSAAELIRCLNHPEIVDLRIGPLIADKKKFELWIDETPIPKIRLIDLIERMQVEKKKLELEVNFFDPTPEPDVMPGLVDQVAIALERRGFGQR